MDMMLVTVLIFGTITQILGWRAFSIEFQNIRSESIRPEIIYFNVTITNKNVLDVHLNVLRDVSQVFVDFEDLHDSVGGTYDLVLINKTVDLCQFLNNRKTNPLFDIVYRVFSENGELPKKCPIRRQRYELLNVVFNPEKFPPFFPDHKAKISAVAWNKEHGKKNILVKFGCKVVFERTFKGIAKV